MSYACYLAGVQMPTPAKLTVKVKNKNKTLILLNEGEINFLRTPGLTEIVVPFVFPMLTGRSPDYYLGTLERLKTSKEPTQFILVRCSPDGRTLYDTNMRVSVEDYNVVEDANRDLSVLRKWEGTSRKLKRPRAGVRCGRGKRGIFGNTDSSSLAGNRKGIPLFYETGMTRFPPHIDMIGKYMILWPMSL